MSLLKVISSFIVPYTKAFQASAGKSVKRPLKGQRVLLIAPHPDDECLMGAIALRLQQENQMEVILVAATLGSNTKRQSARKKEFINAAKKLKSKAFVLPQNSEQQENTLLKYFTRFSPTVVIAPHETDVHPTHVKVSKMVKKVAARLAYSGTLVWTDYWGHIPNPNILVEVHPHQLKTLMIALAEHKGEVSRNPYHLRLPARLADHVRIGSERLQKAGSVGLSFPFGQLYLLEHWKGGKKIRFSLEKPICSLTSDLSDYFI